MQMKLSNERIMGKLFAMGSAMGILVACSFSDAYSHAESVEFLFAEDNQIEQLSEQDEASIDARAPVPADKWLNEPLKRLDYVLMKIEATLKENLEGIAQRMTYEYFEAKPDSHPPLGVGAAFSDEKRRLYLGVDVHGLGKPKKPMKEFCEHMIGHIEMWFPLTQPMDLAWASSVLGVLMRDYYPGKYRDVIQKLANSVAITVTVDSVYNSGGKDTLFEVGCNRQQADGPIVYHKRTYVLGTVGTPKPDSP
jgi:hypothetical protein